MQTRVMAKQLLDLQAPKNDGKGVDCVRAIAKMLARGKYDIASAIWRNEGDNIKVYPDIVAFLLSTLGCSLHLKKNCTNPNCQ